MGEGFLSRWSRLKRTEAAPAASATSPAVPDGGPVDGPSAADPDERPRDPETGAIIDLEWIKSLPRIEDLAPGADLSGFMRAGVPEALRRQALRRLWEIDPVIRDYVSPALDYAYDYNTPGAAPGYGPLSESDIAQAKRFLDSVFSDPPHTRDAVRSQAPVSVDASSCDATSQDEATAPTTEPDTDGPLPDAALRQAAESAVTAEPAKAAPEPTPARQIQSIQSADHEADHVAMQQNRGSGPIAGVSHRRRGGGATPV
jgi:hypothetical protein